MGYYARDIPMSKNGQAIEGAPPPYVSNQSQRGVPITSSVITLNPNTTVIELMAIGGNNGNAGIIGKWGTASVTATNYDIQVNSGQTRLFVVPVSVMGTSSIVGANVQNGLYNSLAVLTATATSCSVLSVEY